MNIVLNGEPKEIEAATIAALVQMLALPVPTLLIEHNGLALHRDEWPARALQAGDRIEIIRIVAGG
ncbi:MAG TPA: sulfur carrier protein ThiS [Chthoniobacteraceae bacterium]|nr:sulfur carrier protein ThiS [Chthoniobacteraceae bacterium]